MAVTNCPGCGTLTTYRTTKTCGVAVGMLCDDCQ